MKLLMSLVGRLRYTPHPSNNKLQAFTPTSLVEASQNSFNLNYNELIEMRHVVEVLANELDSDEPDLIPFFATGGIPLVFPVMEILSKRNRRKLIDGNHFHLFPGLSWNGQHENMNSEDYFKSEFSQLIKNFSSSESGLSIWSVDASFTGNAINKLIKVIHNLFSELDLKPQNATVSIVAIIDASRAPKINFVNSVPLKSEHGTLYLGKSSEFSATEELVENKYTRLTRNEGENLFKLQIKYLVVSTIISEDRAELIGAEASNNFLGIAPVNRISHSKIIFDNGLQSAGTGGSSLGLNFLGWLSTPEDLYPWSKWKEIAKRDPISDSDKEPVSKINELLEDSLSYYDIFLHKKGNYSRNELDKLLKAQRLLKPFEVISLLEAAKVEFEKTKKKPTCISNKLILKVYASTLKNTTNQTEAIALFRLCCPDLATLEPSDLECSDCHLWWGNTLRKNKKHQIDLNSK